MKMKKFLLKNIEFEINDVGGFTLWVREGKLRHWIVDASEWREDGEIRLGNKIPSYKFEAQYRKKTNSIIFVEKK